MELKTKKWFVSSTKKNGHMHYVVKGPDVIKRGLTNIHDRLTKFEEKASLYYVLKLVKQKEDFKSTNYAEIFGAYYE